MEFKRFSEDKQEQIRQFVSYAQMMGLTGKDIRSIGDKLDRIRKTEERDRNRAIIAEYECLPIGDDKRHKTHKTYFQQVLDARFKLKTARGSYNFVGSYNIWKITSLTTKVTKNYSAYGPDYELGDIDWARRSRYAILLDINAGKFLLDF